jgi:tRNA pseudouridine32 synthase/23S rRNA pseudouridine746 synthase
MLPVRNGLGPSVVGLPAGQWDNLLAFLVHRFPAIPAAEWTARMARGDVVDEAGRSVSPDAPYRPHTRLFYYRDVPNEVPIAAQETVLFEDDWLVVADKPHFLPVVPSGRYVHETLLARLRRKLSLDALTPLHRLDRETAGVVLFAKKPETVHLYAEMFAQRRMHKTYEAIAPWRDGLDFPLEHQSRLVTGTHFMQMHELPATSADGTAAPVPNSHTRIEVLEVRATLARYRLTPHTGKRHQLRVHMAALGLPIVGDQIYPVLMPARAETPDTALRLLAQAIAFVDPISGADRQFTSCQTLDFPVPT